jgi:hypothetical protein
MLNTCTSIDVIWAIHQTAGTGNKIIDREVARILMKALMIAQDDEGKKDDSGIAPASIRSLQQRCFGTSKVFSHGGLVLPCFIKRSCLSLYCFVVMSSAPETSRQEQSYHDGCCTLLGMLIDLSLPSPLIPSYEPKLVSWSPKRISSSVFKLNTENTVSLASTEGVTSSCAYIA